jgi:predicted Fe-Mo cluster-binding NifX family protein
MAESFNSALRDALKPRRRAFRPDRVAVATMSGTDIDACFGKTDYFLIYELVEKNESYSYELLERRPGPKPCRDRTHDENILEETAELLKDCNMVLAGRIGPHAQRALSDRGVMALAAPISLSAALSRLAG